MSLVVFACAPAEPAGVRVISVECPCDALQAPGGVRDCGAATTTVLPAGGSLELRDCVQGAQDAGQPFFGTLQQYTAARHYTDYWLSGDGASVSIVSRGTYSYYPRRCSGDLAGTRCSRIDFGDGGQLMPTCVGEVQTYVACDLDTLRVERDEARIPLSDLRCSGHECLLIADGGEGNPPDEPIEYCERLGGDHLWCEY